MGLINNMKKVKRFRKVTEYSLEDDENGAIVGTIMGLLFGFLGGAGVITGISTGNHVAVGAGIFSLLILPGIILLFVLCNRRVYWVEE